MDGEDPREDPQPEYEPPQVEDIPAEDGPAVTAAGKSPQDTGDQGAEWRH